MESGTSNVFLRAAHRHAAWPRALAFTLCAAVSVATHATTFLTTSGSTKSTFKAIATNTDLECNLEGLKVDATAVPPSLVVGGAAGSIVSCSEVDRSSGATIASGLFHFEQTALDNCLAVSTTTLPGKTLYTCAVTGRNTKARWIVRPTAEYRGLFCAGVSNPETNCYAEHGTPDRPRAIEFPARDVTGDSIIDLADGEVLRFAVPSGTLFFGPCHSGSFDAAAKVECLQKVQGNSYATRAAGSAETALTVEIDISPSVNLGNTSDNSSLPTTIYGSADANVGTFSTTDFTLVGPRGSAPLAVESVSIADTGTPDGYPDLKVSFNRGSFIDAVKFVTGDLCPVDQVSMPLTLRGSYSTGAVASGRWTGTDQVVLFGCDK